MPSQPLGDLIVTLKLDRAEYNKNLTAVLSQSTAAVSKAVSDSEKLRMQEFKNLDRIGRMTIAAEKAKVAAVQKEADQAFRMREATQRRLMSVERDHARAIQDNLRWEQHRNRTVLDGNARFGVMANTVAGASTAMRLLGAESVLVTAEMGRVGLYLGRAVVAAREGGGVIAVLTTTLGSFVKAIHPIGWALIAVSAAYGIYKLATGAATEAQEKFNETLKKTRETLAKTKVGVEVASGRMTPTQGRRQELEQEAGVPELQKRVATPTRFDAFLGRGNVEQAKANLTEISSLIQQQLRAEDTAAEVTERKTREQAIAVAEYERHLNGLQASIKQHRASNETADKKEQDRLDAKLERLKEEAALRRKYAAEQTAISHKLMSKQAEDVRDLIATINAARVSLGTLAGSSLMPEGPMKELAKLKEERDAARKAIEDAGGSSFGISTQKAGSFRFGTGPVGSVIGEQSEQKKTTDAIKAMEKTFERKIDEWGAKAFGDAYSQYVSLSQFGPNP